MHIILVPGCMATAKTLNVTPRLLLGVLAAIVSLALLLSVFFAWVGVYFSLPFASQIVEAAQQNQQERSLKNEKYLQDNVSSLAVKLGEMQARVMRLDLLGERISKMTGVTPPVTERKDKGGQGGPLIRLSQALSTDELQRDIDRLATQIEERSELLTAIESQLMERRIKATLLPTIVPVALERVGSVFGRRLDPLAGVGAMHEGIDFVVDTGSRVVASAGGVVTTAEYHPQYGNLVEIDHGNEFSSRYAHMSRLDVRVGQVVKRAQAIGASGNTGRSTGPHLHFEVRFKGVAQDPARFLKQDTQLVSNPEASTGTNSKLAVRPAKRDTARAGKDSTRVSVSFNVPH